MLCVKSETCTSILWDHKNQSKWSLELCQFAVWQVWHTESYQSQQQRMTTFKKKRTNKSLKPPSSFWHDFWRKIKWANWQNMKEMAKRNRKWTKRNVTADALAMCMLRVVHVHCHHLTHPRHYIARYDPTPTGFESSMQSTAAFTRISILWGPLWDFLLCIVDADICLLFRLLLFTAHSSSMF